MMKEKLLLIPGPTPVSPRIRNILAAQTVSHVSPELANDLRDSLENLKKILFCRNGQPFIVAGAGTLAMEMALLNLTGPHDRALIISQGYFGQRMAEICQAFGIDYELMASDWGKVVETEELKKKLSSGRFDVVFCTHVDTSTGAEAPVEEYARAVRNHGALFVVDGVCATGGIMENMDDWEIDVAFTAAQKCFGVPPGLSVLVFSEKAMAKRQSLPSVKAYYGDVLRWLPIMQEPFRYFSTPCVNEIRAFAEATRIILEEGLERRFFRHRIFARAIRDGLAALGFKFYTDSNCLASTLSVVVYPEGIEDRSFREELGKNGVVVAGGLGTTAGRVFRMGHMGNISVDDVLFALEAIEKTLEVLDHSVSRGAAVEAAKKVLDELSNFPGEK